MYARVNYTCTKNVNSRLWNPGYSLNKVIGTVAQSITTPLTQNEATDFSALVERQFAEQTPVAIIENKTIEKKEAKVTSHVIEKPRASYAQITKGT